MPPIRIFVSSPSDVREERLRAQITIAKIARDFDRLVEIVPYFWESEPQRATGHFQDEIALPSSHDIVVLILWSRLGTPLPERTDVREYKGIDGRQPVTGTEWEFEEALAAYRERRAPDLLVYRRSGDPGASLADGDLRARQEAQWRALQDFWSRHFEDRGRFIGASSLYASLTEFDAKLERDLTKLVEARLRSLAASPDGAVRLKGPPYRGLSAYAFADAPIFFGRDGAISTALTRLLHAAENGCAFLLVSGASGAGKSSLARAGLLPALVGAKAVPGVGLWRRVVFRPSDGGADPIESLAQALLASPSPGEGLPELAAGTSAADLAAHLRAAADDPSFVFKSTLRQVSERERSAQALLPHEDARLVILVDQLEELFTRPAITPAEQATFIRVLAGLARSGHVWVIATIRSDFWSRAVEIPKLLEAVDDGARIDVLPPTNAELSEMIRRPARAAGLEFEVDKATGLPLDAVLGEAAAAQKGVLPLLSVLLEDLYQRDVRAGDTGPRRLTYASYHALGALEGAIATRAEAIWFALHQSDPEAAAALPDVLRALVTQGAAGTFAAKPARLEEFPAGSAARRLIDAMSSPQARLLVLEAEGGAAEVRLAHEALIAHWPRAKRQVELDQRDLETRARLDSMRRAFESRATGKGEALLTGLALEEGIDLRERWKLAPTSQLGAFIRLSEQRRSRRRRVAFGVTFGLIALFATIAGLATVKWREAAVQTEAARRNEQEAQKQTAFAREETSRANDRTVEAETEKRKVEQERQIAQGGRAAARAREALLLEDPTKALAIVGQQIKAGLRPDWRHTPDLARVLLAARRESHLVTAFPGHFLSAALSDGGGVIGLLSVGSLEFRDVTTGALRATVETDAIKVDAASGIGPKLALSADGTWAAAADRSQILLVSSVKTSPRKTLSCKGMIGPFFFIDGMRLLWTCDTTVSVTRLTSDQPDYSFDLGDDWEPPLEAAEEKSTRVSLETYAHDYKLQAIAFDPDRGLIATQRQLRRSKDGQVLLTFSTESRGTISSSGVAFSPDGKYVSVDKIWDLAKRRPLPGFFTAGEGKPDNRDRKIVTLAREDQAITVENDADLNAFFLRKQGSNITQTDHTWSIGTDEQKLMSALAPSKDNLEYSQGFYQSGTDSVLFTAARNLLNAGRGIFLLKHEHSFRVFRGDPELPYNYRGNDSAGLFLTRDVRYVYVWQTTGNELKFDLPTYDTPNRIINFAKGASVYLNGDSVCSAPTHCRPIKVSGKEIDVLNDDRVVSVELSDSVVTLTDETGHQMARLDFTPWVSKLDPDKLGLRLIGMTSDGACLAMGWDEGSDRRRVLVRKTTGDQALVADIAYAGSTDESAVVGSQVFVGGDKQRSRVDCHRGTRSDDNPRHEYRLSTDGSHIIATEYEGDIDKKVAVAAEIHAADTYKLLRRLKLDDLAEVQIDVDPSGDRYIVGNIIYRTSDGTKIAQLDKDYDVFSFVPGRNALVATRVGGFGRGERMSFFDATTFELMTTEDGAYANAGDNRMIGPGRAYLASGSRAYLAPTLSEADALLELYDRAGLSALGD